MDSTAAKLMSRHQQSIVDPAATAPVQKHLQTAAGGSHGVQRRLQQLLSLLDSPQYLPGSKRRRDAIVGIAQTVGRSPVHQELRCCETLLQLVHVTAADPWSEIRSHMASALGELLSLFDDGSVCCLAESVLSSLAEQLVDWKMIDGYSRVLHPIVARLGAGITAELAHRTLSTALHLVGHEQLQIRKTGSRLAVHLRAHLDVRALVATLASEIRADLEAFAEEHCRSIEGALLVFAGMLEVDPGLLTSSVDFGDGSTVSELRGALQAAFGHPSSTVRQSASDTWVRLYHASLPPMPEATTKLLLATASGSLPPAVVTMLDSLVGLLKTRTSWQHTEGCMMTVESIASALVLAMISGRDLGICSSPAIQKFVREVDTAILQLTVATQFEIRRMLAQLISPLAWITTFVSPLSVPHLLHFQLSSEEAVASNTYAFAMLRESLCVVQWLEETARHSAPEPRWGLTRLSNSLDEKNLLQQLKTVIRENLNRVQVQSQIFTMLDSMQTAMVAVLPFITDLARRAYQAAPATGTDVAATLVVLRSYIWCSRKASLTSTSGSASGSCSNGGPRVSNDDAFVTLQILHDLRTQTAHFVAKAATARKKEDRSSSWTKFRQFAQQAQVGEQSLIVSDEISESEYLTRCWKCAAEQWAMLSETKQHQVSTRANVPLGFRPPMICVGGLVALSASSQDTIPAMVARDLQLAERALCEELASVLPSFALSLEWCPSPAAPVMLALIVADWLADVTADPLRGGRRRVRLLQYLCRAISNAATQSALIDCKGYQFPVGHGWAVVGVRLAELIALSAFDKGALPELVEAAVDVVVACRANRTDASTATLSAALARYILDCCNSSVHDILQQEPDDSHSGDDGQVNTQQTPANADIVAVAESQSDDNQSDDPWADWDDDSEGDDGDGPTEIGEELFSYSPQTSPFSFHTRNPSSPLTGTPGFGKPQSETASRQRIALNKDRLVKFGSDLPFVLPADGLDTT